MLTISRINESLLIASKEKTKYMVMSRDQNAEQNGYIQIGNKLFETVKQFKYLETTLTNIPFMKKLRTD